MEESTSIQRVKVPKLKIVELTNSQHTKKLAHNELPHLDLHFQIQSFNSQSDITWALFAHSTVFFFLTLTCLQSERPKLYAILAFLSAKGLKVKINLYK